MIISLFSETQDDVETITNEIKKAANNARNKLKSLYLFFKPSLWAFI